MASDSSAKKRDSFTKEEGTTIASNKDRTYITLSHHENLVPVFHFTRGSHKGTVLSFSEHQKMTIGRGTDCEFTVQDSSCSRKHATIYVAPDDSIYVKDLNSTNGTRINGKRISEPHILKNDDRIQIGEETLIKFQLVPRDEAKIQLDVYNRATRDQLTGAFNKRHFMENIDREVSYIRRGPKGQGIGVIIFDIDFFKKVNDTHGHIAGDRILKELGYRVMKLIRKEDLFSRFGGEEFTVLVRNDNFDGVKELCERLRKIICESPVQFENKSISFSISLGATVIQGPTSISSEQLLEIADKALYESKNNGRNQTTIIPAEDQESSLD